MKNDAGSEENKTVNADGFMRMLGAAPTGHKESPLVPFGGHGFPEQSR
jgi:hypothetical protein